MDERGFGYIADMLVFALLLSTATLLLAGANPVDPRAVNIRYASSFAQSTLRSLQNTTAGQFGGFGYELNTSEWDFSVAGGSTRRELRYKTLAQLLAEDALLNLQVDADGADLLLSRSNQGMNKELKEFLKSALDQIIGGRFGYRLRARTEPIDLEFARVHFETVIEDLARSRTQLCSETVMLSLPASREVLMQSIEEALSADLFGQGLEADPILEVTLELWSR